MLPSCLKLLRLLQLSRRHLRERLLHATRRKRIHHIEERRRRSAVLQRQPGFLIIGERPPKACCRCFRRLLQCILLNAPIALDRQGACARAMSSLRARKAG